ncbi:protein adenylyltransferase SelO [Gynuella sunshinyii]|uniref:protein adenylyltransferase SelO n=1 Tax=Gynuella sunshinyii TaxID=1445505 RepID=UPI0005CC6580|nr:YdiU family protein [Gynuella sunshinyii]
MPLHEILKPLPFRQLDRPYVVQVSLQGISEPYLISENSQLRETFQIHSLREDDISLLSGHRSADAVASVYAGHQFGGYTPRLGDGRAALIGGLEDRDQRIWEVQLKGSGMTPFSRMGDGRAVLRSSVREYLMSENMAGLGIPTTRALAITGSDDVVIREARETAAMVTRVARSFLRFGHYQFFFHTNQHEELKALIDFTLEQYFPDCLNQAEPIAALFTEVVQRTARLIAAWQAQGWCHGVMNTDNFSILGDTIDYGPFGFMDRFDPAFICNHSDDYGRYAYDQQPKIGLWNLVQLGNCLTPWVAVETLQRAVDGYNDCYQRSYMALMAQKLGVAELAEDQRESLTIGWLELLGRGQMDYHFSFTGLTQAELHERKPDVRNHTLDLAGFDAWWQQYSDALKGTSATSRRQQMHSHNPYLVLRNWVAQEAIEAAEKKDFTLINALLPALQQPFQEYPELASYAQLPPDWSKSLAVSCSS